MKTTLVCGTIAFFMLFACTREALAAKGSLLATYNLGAARFAYDSTANRLYTTVPGQNSVAVIDASNLSLLTNVFIGSNPYGLSLSEDGSRLYVGNAGSAVNAIGVLNTATLTTLPALSLPVAPADVAVGKNDRVYAVPAGYAYPHGIMQVDGKTGAYLGDFGVGNLYAGGLLATSPDRQSLYYEELGFSSSYLTKYSISSGNGTQVYRVATGDNGQDLAISHNGSFFAARRAPYVIEIRRTSDAAVLGSLNVGAYPREVTFSPDDAVAYADHTSGVIDIYSTQTYLSLGPISISGEAEELIVDRSGRFLFAAVAGQLRVYDTGRVVGTPATIGLAGSLAQSVIRGGTATLNVTVDNTANSDAASLVYSLSQTAVTGLTLTSISPSSTGILAPNAAAIAHSFSASTTAVTSLGNKTITVTAADSLASNSAQQVDLSLTVLDHSNGSFNSTVIDTNSLTLNFGKVIQNAPVQTLGFSIGNLAGANIADLKRGTVTPAGPNTAQLTSSLSSLNFSNLASGTSQAFTASMSTATIGTLSASYTAAVADQDLPGATANASPLTLNLTGQVLSHADATFSNTSGSAHSLLTANGDVLTLDFGTVPRNAGGGRLGSVFDLVAEIVTAGSTARLDLDGIEGSGDVAQLFKLAGPDSFNTLEAGSKYSFEFDLNTIMPGSFSAVFLLHLSDEDLPGATNQVLTLNLAGTVVPEPSALLLALVGAVGLIGVRQRCRVRDRLSHRV